MNETSNQNKQTTQIVSIPLECLIELNYFTLTSFSNVMMKIYCANNFSGVNHFSAQYSLRRVGVIRGETSFKISEYMCVNILHFDQTTEYIMQLMK